MERRGLFRVILRLTRISTGALGLHGFRSGCVCSLRGRHLQEFWKGLFFFFFFFFGVNIKFYGGDRVSPLAVAS